MDEVITIIDKILEEHRTIMQRLQRMEQVANDTEAMAGLDKAKEVFMPGRLEQKEGLKKLKELQEKVEQGLYAHFNWEETALMSAVEKHGEKKIASALQTLLIEHKDLRNRIAHSKKHVADLLGGGLSRTVWEATAHDMRAHISHTRKLLEAHAAIEQELLQELRDELVKSQK